MRFIEKGTEPDELRAFKALENDDWKPAWGLLHAEHKQAMRAGLCREQRGLCAYCERRIHPWSPALRPADARKGDAATAVEHFVPRSDPTRGDELALDWTNLIGVCRPVDVGFPVCENGRGNTPLHVHPALDRSTSRRFIFGGDGAVSGADHDAQADIETLRLDVDYYRARRKAAVSGALRFLAEGEGALRSAIAEILEPSDDERLPEFVTAVQQVVRRELERLAPPV